MPFVLLLLLFPAAPSAPVCHLEKIHRHKPRVCSERHCDVCRNKECVRLKCPHARAPQERKRSGY